MNLKGIVKASLLVFVAGSVGYAINSELRKPPQQTVPSDSKKPEPIESSQIIAYYFHGNARCASCLKIERNTYKAITEQFDNEIRGGKIYWKVINVEEPANNHFVQDYKLHTKSVVLSLMHNGKEEKWKNLEKVWEYLQDENQFHSYVITEVSTYLGELPR